MPGPSDDASVYIFDNEDLVLAVNIAIAVQRPLLVFGPPGSGKSTLAANAARVLNWRYHSETITARTEPEDLLWRFDALQRLNDAQAGQVQPIGAYYRPAVLWKAFSPQGPADQDTVSPSADGSGSVVLLDEIDKADPDLPNSLLGPLGEWSFTVPDGRVITAQSGWAPLVIITSNDEHDLSRPFLRRCIIITLPDPTAPHLLAVASAHLGNRYDEGLATQVVEQLIETRQEALRLGVPGPSTAEFLDALYACTKLGITVQSPQWRALSSATLRKYIDRRGASR